MSKDTNKTQNLDQKKSKSKKKYPTKALLVDENGKEVKLEHKSRIRMDPILAENAFRLWMLGYGLYEIYKIFSKTDSAFNYLSLYDIKVRNKWDERKAELVKLAKRETEDLVLVGHKKQIKALQMLLDMNLAYIEKSYLQYHQDPDAYLQSFKSPPWMATNIKEFSELVKTLSGLTGFGEKEDVDLIGGASKLLGLEVSKHEKIFAILRQVANERAGISNQIIDNVTQDGVYISNINKNHEIG